MTPKTVKTALLAVVLLASSAGYLWHLQLYFREERTLRTVASSGYDTLDPVGRGYSSKTRAYADNVTLTFRATGNVTVTFLKWVDDGEGGLIEVPVRALTAKTLVNYTFSGYDRVGIGLDPAENISVGIYVEIIKPRWETRKTHLEEAATYGYISSAGLLFVGSWLLLEVLWRAYAARTHPGYKRDGSISQTRYRLLGIISPLPAALILYWMGFIAFGAVFYDRSPAPYESLLTWLLVALARTGISLYATSLALGRPLDQTLTKRNLLLAFFLVGPAHPLTQMTLINLTAITTWTKSLDPFLLTWLLQPVQDAVRAWFTSVGHSYEFYLSVYFSALDPLIVDLPRLLALILVSRAREPEHDEVNSSFYYGSIFLLFINTKSKEIRRTARSISTK